MELHFSFTFVFSRLFSFNEWLPQSPGILLFFFKSSDSNLISFIRGDSCIAGLKEMGFNVEVYSDVIADPPEARIIEAIEFAKANNISGVVGFGGGSSMDVAKVVAFLGQRDCKQSIQDIYGVGMCNGSRMPLIQVPTTAGTGSEVTPISIVTTGESEKKGIVSLCYTQIGLCSTGN